MKPKAIGSEIVRIPNINRKQRPPVMDKRVRPEHKKQYPLGVTRWVLPGGYCYYMIVFLISNGGSLFFQSSFEAQQGGLKHMLRAGQVDALKADTLITKPVALVKKQVVIYHFLFQIIFVV